MGSHGKRCLTSRDGGESWGRGPSALVEAVQTWVKPVHQPRYAARLALRARTDPLHRVALGPLRAAPQAA
eukprot:10210799-Alexandrium_andersonii.AAC.1